MLGLRNDPDLSAPGEVPKVAPRIEVAGGPGIDTGSMHDHVERAGAAGYRAAMKSIAVELQQRNDRIEQQDLTILRLRERIAELESAAGNAEGE